MNHQDAGYSYLPFRKINLYLKELNPFVKLKEDENKTTTPVFVAVIELSSIC